MLRLHFLPAACALALIISAGAADALERAGSGWHGGGRHSVGRYGAGYYGYYGGYGAVYHEPPAIQPVGERATPAPLGPVIPTSYVLGCHHSRDVVTVPSEEGGTRQITITRC